MVQVTAKATEMIKEFFKSREKIEPLRIFVAGIG
jgi:Fe-S cluster assembly iron-binding protein IscA